MAFILEPSEISREFAGKRVDVREYPNGVLYIRHNDPVLPYRVFDNIRQVNQAAIRQISPVQESALGDIDYLHSCAPGSTNTYRAVV